MIIDCESCALYDPSLTENDACNDCVVSVIISIDSLAASAKREQKATPDHETDQALALLSSRGLVPPMRYLPVNFS